MLSAVGAAPADPRIRVVDYAPDQVVPLDLVVGQHLHLQFAPDERFVNLAAGDTRVLEAGAEGPHLMLKPLAVAGPMALTVLTTRRLYQFEYRALRSGAVVHSLRFRYAGPPPAAPVAVNRDYAYCGSPALKPLAAEDDGVQTRLTFAVQAELPAVFVATDEGESLVNGHVEDTTLVVHRTAARFVLRRGRQVGCVVNRAYAAAGATLTRSRVPGTTRVLTEDDDE